jgi:threonine dehydratase
VPVKHEDHLPTNAFKARNAVSFMTALSPEQRARGVIAATRGNHGAGSRGPASGSASPS